MGNKILETSYNSYDNKENFLKIRLKWKPMVVNAWFP